jgi:lipopolysaccharide export LptBFGC system permease protein LptF
MNAVNIASIIIALISLLGALASNRSAKNAEKIKADAAKEAEKTKAEASQTNAKLEVEKDAYNRARKMDIETIQRQDLEIEELRQANLKLKTRLKEVEDKADEQEIEIRLLKREVRLLRKKSQREEPDE